MPQPGLEWVEQIRVKINGADIPLEMMDALEEVVVDSSLYLPDMCILSFVDTDNFDIADDALFDMGKPVEVELPLDQPNATTVKVFKGEIVAIEPTFGSDVGATFMVRAFDKSHRLSRGKKIKAWKDSTDSDIASKIATDNGLSPQVESTGQVYKHVYQHNQTDMEFLTMRAQRIGYEFYADNEKLYFQKPKGSRGEATLEWGTSLRSFKPRLTLAQQVNEVSVKGWDPDQKQAIIGQATSSSSSPSVGFGKWGGQAAQSAFSAAKQVVVRRPIMDQREADTLAQALLDEINAGFIEADGVAVGNPNLKAGMKVKIEKVSQKFSGTYHVTAARHVYTPEGYETYFTVQGARPQLMTDLIESQSVFSDRDVYFGGVVPAVVTNINDDEHKGRVKLKYPWLDDQEESWWARVAATGAGNQRGFLWMPEVNDEVLVAFEHGDFNRPYIVGSLWNGRDAPPESWSNAVQNGKSEIRIMKSREGHIIRMVDGPSDKFIEIVDSAQGTTIKLDANAKKLFIESKDEISVKTSTNLKVDTSSNVEIAAKSNVKIDAKGNIDITATGNVTIKGTGNVDVQASGMLTLKGSMVNIN